MEITLELVYDAELEAAAQVNGPDSVEAQVLARLRIQRSKDRQVHAFRIGNYWMTGPTPDTRTEIAMIELADANDDDDTGKA
jgi:hypothetical protein